MPLNKAAGGYMVAPPCTAAAAAAAALWAAPPQTHLSSCVGAPGVAYAASVLSAGALGGDVSQPRANNYGGLNVDPWSVAGDVFYDPRTVAMRAPIAASGVDGELVTAPSMRHGVAPFISGGAAELAALAASRTQYAPHGHIPMPEPLKLGLTPCTGCMQPGTLCAASNFPAFSLTAVMLTPRNALAVRDAMEAAGIVRVTRRLRALGARACACTLLGTLYAGYAAFASQFEDTSIASVPNVAATVAALNAEYVETTLGGIRTQVLARARLNYARAEGPRAELSMRPHIGDDGCCATCGGVIVEGMCACGGAVCGPGPLFLPGSGARVAASDTYVAGYALATPAASLAHRAALSMQTGLNIGQFPGQAAWQGALLSGGAPTRACEFGQTLCAPPAAASLPQARASVEARNPFVL